MNRPAEKPSALMLEECFNAQDERFLSVFTQFSSSDFLVKFVRKWIDDTRPWARQQVMDYLQYDLNFAGHEVVIKRLFKHFEAQGDHQVMASFMVAMDRIVRRSRVTRGHYDRRSRQYTTEQVLFARANRTVHDQRNRKQEYRHGRHVYSYGLPDLINRPTNRQFSHKTRNYLRRRVWRYFRHLSFRDPAAYVASVSTAMCGYLDADFAAGENIIDNWSLMHACYFHHDALLFTAAHTNLAEGRALSELSPAPYQPTAWESDEGFAALWTILTQAQSSLVRQWAIELLQSKHISAGLQVDVAELMQLLSHSDQRVQEFAAGLFREHTGLPSLPITQWLALVRDANHATLPLICEAMKKYVTAERMDNLQIVQLACAQPVPVARLGCDMLYRRHESRPLSAETLVMLASAKCEALCTEITRWALTQLCDAGCPTNDVVEFFDALLTPMRQEAMAWLEESDSPGHNDSALWAKLVESPFDDVRLRLVDCLQHRASLPSSSVNDLSPVWTSVILGVHRGGRSKPKAIRQLQQAILGNHEHAERLLPVLAVALRSVRLPERRSAMAALAVLGNSDASLKQAIVRHIPELHWMDPLQPTGRIREETA